MIASIFTFLIFFPGTRHASIDPSHRYELSWREATSDQPHELLFRKFPAEFKILVREFDRSVEVIWSPSGDSFLVNDHEGSDSSRVYVYNSVRPTTAHELRAELPSPVAQALDKSHHAYLSASKWIDESTVLLRAHGYGTAQPSDFDLLVRCRHRGSVWSCASASRRGGAERQIH